MTMRNPLDTIWKFEIPVSDEFTLEMPAGSIPLSVGVQRGQPVLWSAVDSSTKEKEWHRFHLIGTGHPFPNLLDHRFIGTFQVLNGDLVFHLFDGGPA